jgi:peptide/nickel transport system ATP-binding protein
VIDVRDLTAAAGGHRLLHGVSFALGRGETLALLGASGSGKSLTGRALLALPPRGIRYGGTVSVGGRDLLGLPERALCRVRGREATMIFQEPATALNPAHPIGRQIGEALAVHGIGTPAERQERVAELLSRTGLAAAGVGPERHPHSLSGGQRQRVAVAIALAARPALVVADEPTSALDSLAAARVLDLLFDLVGETGAALVLVTHDLLVARRAGRVAIMSGGRIVEAGPMALLDGPASAEGRALVAGARLDLPSRLPRPAGPPVLEAERVTVARGGRVVVSNARLSVAAGERVAIVGGSGSGKTSLARALLGLLPHGGSVRVHGQPATAEDVRRIAQMVFQDPATSFDGRQTVARIVAEPLWPERPRRMRDRVAAALARVGLGAEALDRRPHAFSGGQRQRIAIARALVSRPQVLIADEPVSALDAALRAEVAALLDDLARDGLALILIAHDMAFVRALADRVVVMDAGTIVEEGPVDEVLARPRHSVTRALLAAGLTVPPPVAAPPASG